MPAGRPREVSLPPEEMIELGKEMIEWVTKNDPYHLSQWYCGIKGIIFSDWDTMSKRPEFVPYYEKAMMLIGEKYIKKDSEIEPALKQRWQRLYFKDLKRQEDQDLNEEAERKKKIESAKNDRFVLIANPALTAGSNVSTENISTENIESSK